MSQGYKEIVESFQYQCLRQIRGDNYCALRSAIFQTLAQGLPVPCGTKAMARLSKAHNIGSQWYQRWKFSNLPYTGSNILRGMEICLQSLDNISVSTVYSTIMTNQFKSSQFKHLFQLNRESVSVQNSLYFVFSLKRILCL